MVEINYVNVLFRYSCIYCRKDGQYLRKIIFEIKKKITKEAA